VRLQHIRVDAQGRYLSFRVPRTPPASSWLPSFHILLIANGADVYAKGGGNGTTPLDMAIRLRRTATIDLLRKHGGKTGAELKAEEK